MTPSLKETPRPLEQRTVKFGEDPKANGENQEMSGDAEREKASFGVNGCVSECNLSVEKSERPVENTNGDSDKTAESVSRTGPENESSVNSRATVDGRGQNGLNVNLEGTLPDWQAKETSTANRDEKLEGQEPESESGEEIGDGRQAGIGTGEPVPEPLENGHVAGVPPKVRLRIQACPKPLETFFTDSIPDVEVGMVRMRP